MIWKSCVSTEVYYTIGSKQYLTNYQKEENYETLKAKSYCHAK